MDNITVPLWQQYTLSVNEAAMYFRIGRNKLREMINNNPDADYIVWNNSRPLIKRILFEKYIDGCNVI